MAYCDSGVETVFTRRLLRFALAGFLTASALLIVAPAATAQSNSRPTIGFGGGYGIAQPSYVPPQPFYGQPPPVTMQWDWRDGRSQWREQQEWREREWQHRQYQDDTRRSHNGAWGAEQPPHGNRDWPQGPGGHERHNGWQR